MRLLSILMVLGCAGGAIAQEASPPPTTTTTTTSDLPPVPPRVYPPLLPASTYSHWRGARALYVTGGVVGLLSTGLSLSSAIYVLATDYPPSAGDLVSQAKPSDVGPVLADVGAGLSVVGFAMSAGGLGWQHRILGDLHADPGRGLFIGGTTIGVLGLVAVGASYFFSFTDYMNPHDRTIVALSTSLGGALLCSIGSLLFTRDSSRLVQRWRSLTSF